jgi:CDP-diacylglycerol--glycerol-3-phosphate 3-phosphatidyltransferase
MENLFFHLLRLLGIAVIGYATVRFFTVHSAHFSTGPRHPWFGRFTPHVPNTMSLVRMPLGIWIFLVVALPSLHTPALAWTMHVAFLLVCLFDGLDGYFARKWGVVSADGQSLDPASDKFATLCLAGAAFCFGKLASWAIILLVAREVISMIQRARLRRKGRDVSARWLGKLKTPIQFSVLYLLILRIPSIPVTLGFESLLRAMPAGLFNWGVLLMCFFTVISVFPFFESFSYVNSYAPADPDRPRRPKLLVLIPNLFTVGNYLCGVTAVYFAMPGVDVPRAAAFVSLFWLLAAGLCDAVDGPLARRFKTLSEFGACLDSSMDLSTFGLAAACVIYFQLSGLLILGDLASAPLAAHLAAGLVAVTFFTSVHTRLQRFTALEKLRVNPLAKADFVGMPSPAGAVGALILFTFLSNPWLIAMLTLALAGLMCSRYNFPNLVTALKNPFYRYIFIPAVLLAFLGLYLLMFFYPFLERSHFNLSFEIIAWMLFPSLIVYTLHGLARGMVKVDWTVILQRAREEEKKS